MSSLFDFTPRCHTFAVMGNPIKHSKSPVIHQLFAKQTGQRITYDAIQVDPGGFQQAVGNFHANGGQGLNITVPFKHEAWEFADELTPRAKHAQAVNTFVFRQDGTILGDNTDGVGLVTDIQNNHNYPLNNKRILILGAGGAVCGILGPLLAEKPANIHIVNRTVHKAEALVQHFAAPSRLTASGYNDLTHGAHHSYDLIINGTSSSLQGDLPPLTANLIVPDKTFCYDLMYTETATVFMQWGKNNGARHSHDGLGMLIEQAAEAFRIWLGVKPETKAVLQYFRQHTA